MLAAHRAWFAGVRYMPKFPWKKGERDAFRHAPSAVNDATHPIFVIPPAGDFDHDLQRIISPAQHVRLFGKRLFESRNRRPVFIDANYLDDDRHRVEFNVHPLTALLERARLSGAQAWPLTAYGRSDFYQEAVAKAHISNDCPVAMQISLADLGMANLAGRLTSLCNQVSCDPDDAVLVIDAGPLALRGEEDEALFASLLIERLNELPKLYEWRQIVFSATSLSDPQKMKPGEEKTVRRGEWHVYRHLLARKTEIYRVPTFSDYGVEFRTNLKPIKASPSAKLSYTTYESHFLVKGQNVKVGGYAAIYPVADTIAKSPHFMGETFSLGDGKIWALRQRRSKTGHAPIWRWAAVDHHLATIWSQIAAELGERMPAHEVTAPELQQIVQRG